MRKIHTGKHLLHALPIQYSLKQDALLPLLFNFALEYTIRKVQKIRWDWKWKNASAPGLWLWC